MGDAIGEWAAPAVPKALADNIGIGFDVHSVIKTAEPRPPKRKVLPKRGVFRWW